MNKVEIKYSSEIIDFLENNLPLQDIQNLAKDCYFESIKCYNDQMAYYFENQYLQDQNLIVFSSQFYSYDFLYNIEFIDEKMIGNLSFEKLCQAGSYFYCNIYLLQNPSFDINTITEHKQFNEEEPREYYYGASDLYRKLNKTNSFVANTLTAIPQKIGLQMLTKKF